MAVAIAASHLFGATNAGRKKLGTGPASNDE
jgi:hypothetical protein